MGPPEANHYGRVWFLLAFFTYQADGLFAKASAQVPVLYDWQQDGARLVLFDFGSKKRTDPAITGSPEPVGRRQSRPLVREMIPVLVISLANSTARRAAVSRQLDDLGIVFSFVEAIDGRRIDSAEIAQLRPAPGRRSGGELTRPEIGVAATYHRLFLQIASGNDPFVCVLEDDAILDRRASYLLESAYLASLPAFDILRLGHGGMNWPRRYVTVSRSNGFTVIAPLLMRGLMHAQIVTRAGAKRIAEGMVPLRAAIDTHLFDDSFVRGLRVLQTKPALAIQNRELPSTILPPRRPALAPRTPMAAIKRSAARTASFLRGIRSYVDAWGWVSFWAALARRNREPARLR